MSEDGKTRHQQPGNPDPEAVELAGARRRESPDGSTKKLVTVANLGLVGVPLAYVTTQSVAVTVLAAVSAVAMVIAYLLSDGCR